MNKKPLIYKLIGIVFIISWFSQLALLQKLFGFTNKTGLIFDGSKESIIKLILPIIVVFIFYFIIYISINYFRMTMFSFNIVKINYLLSALFMTLKLILNIFSQKYSFTFYIFSIIIIVINIAALYYLIQKNIHSLVQESDKARKEKKHSKIKNI